MPVLVESCREASWGFRWDGRTGNPRDSPLNAVVRPIFCIEYYSTGQSGLKVATLSDRSSHLHTYSKKHATYMFSSSDGPQEIMPPLLFFNLQNVYIYLVAQLLVHPPKPEPFLCSMII